MTPEQKERITASARAFAADLTEVGGDFKVSVDRIEVRFIGDERPKYHYAITVTARTEEVIA